MTFDEFMDASGMWLGKDFKLTADGQPVGYGDTDFIEFCVKLGYSQDEVLDFLEEMEVITRDSLEGLVDFVKDK